MSWESHKNKEIAIGDVVMSMVVQDRNGKPVNLRAELTVTQSVGENLTVIGTEYEGNKKWKLKAGDVRTLK